MLHNIVHQTEEIREIIRYTIPINYLIKPRCWHKQGPSEPFARFSAAGTA